MNRRQFLAGLAAGVTVAFTRNWVTELPSGVVRLDTEDAFLLTTANPLYEKRLEEATFVHRLDEDQWLVWGDDPTTLGELERIRRRNNFWVDYANMEPYDDIT